MGPAERELKLRMTVVADTTGATQSLQRLTAEAHRTGAAMAGRGGGGGGNPAFGGFGGAGGATGARAGLAGMGSAGGGMLGMAGAALGPVGLGLLGANQLGQSAAAVGRSLNDPYQDNLGAGRDLFRSIVPFGSTIQSWSDDITGRTAGMEQAQVKHQQNQAAMQGRLQMSAFNLSHNPQQAGLDARARGLAGARAIGEGSFDRSSAEGEKAFRDRQRMLPLERESAKAEREAAAASAQRTASNKELANIEKRQVELVGERRKLEKQSENTSGVERQRAILALQRNEQETQALGGQRQQAAGQVAAATNADAQARAGVQMVGVRKLQSEAQGLEEDAAQAAGGARRLGMMSSFERSRAAEAVRQAQTSGVESLTERQRQLAMSVAPETLGKKFEEVGARSGAFADLTKSAPADFAGDPEKLRKEAAAKRDEAAKKELDVEASVAKVASEAGREQGKLIADAIKKGIESQAREIILQILGAKNAK